MVEEQNPIQVTTKNPKKVEAGKRLAEYNRKKRDELKKATPNSAETTPNSDETTPNRDESTSAMNNNNNNYVMSGVIALGLAGGFAYFMYNKKKDSKPKSPQKSKIPVKISKLEME